ncbi:hypothetical protein RVR_P179 (plasmid) [Actinacidiphila reveromycinica]|uniref:Uncharacterized protein n=1 Tax=Actinacidiphila reveromycinica TaxID=659352 RepID=A0A7U3LGB7_9ACTN|nr:hypothetical protein [Streptomyces sp. SN-593]BBG20697.1 hypothetical protein RVR_P179 [Streptomyces sp. SN-593]
MNSITPAAQLRYLCAQFLAATPSRECTAAAEAAAAHVRAAYPNTLGVLVGETSHWTAYRGSYTQGLYEQFETCAVAWLGDGTWLHHEIKDGSPDIHRLALILPCSCGAGYRGYVIGLHPMNPRSGNEDDLAKLLDRLSSHNEQRHPHSVRPCSSQTTWM